MLRRLLLGKGAAPTYALQPKPTASQGGGGFFSTSLPRSSSSSSSDSPSLITFFREYGIREEVANVILGKLPRLRNANVENTLRPKLQFLLSTNLTGVEISEILTVNPHLLVKSLESTISYINFLKTIVTSKDDLIRILKRSLNLASNIESNVEILKQRGVRGAQILNMLISQPNAFARRKEDFLAAVGHVEDLGLSPNNGLPYVRALALMSYMSRSTFLRKVEVYKQLGWSQDQVVELIWKFPNAMSLSEGSIRKKVEFFREKAGWSEDKVVELIRKSPMVICLSEDNIRKKMDFFRQKAGWSENQVMEVIRKSPMVICLSEDSIRRKMEFFREKVGWSEDQVVEVIRKFPMVLALSEGNFRKKMEFLREKAGWSEDQVAEVIRRFPNAMGLSEDNMRKKMEFFREKVGWGTDCLSANPDLLGRSLEKKVIPRCVVLNILMSRGLLKKELRSPCWLRYTDKRFFDKYVRRYEIQVPRVVDAFHGHIDFQGWDWLKGDDGHNDIN